MKIQKTSRECINSKLLNYNKKTLFSFKYTETKILKTPFVISFLSSDISLLNILNIQKVSVYSKVYKATKTFYILLFATISVLIGPFFSTLS